MNRKGWFERIGPAALLAAAFLFTGCAASSPEGRAQKNPQLMERLSPDDRALVLRGEIREGMNQDAVFLAWGAAEGVTTGSEGGVMTETWRYTALRPVFHGPGFYYPGYAVPYRSHHGPRAYVYAPVPPPPDYIPVTSAVVKFRAGRVISWEKAAR